MADIQDLGGGIDVTRGIRTGLNILGGVQQLKRGKAQEERAQETFELEQEANRQALEIQAQQEADRQETRLIDKLERRYEMAVKNKNFADADRLRFEMGQASGVHLGGDHEELANLLSDRRAAVKANDKEEVDAIDDYLSVVRRISPEEASRVLGLTGEVEEFEAERKFGRKLKEEQVTFDIKETRRKAAELERSEKADKLIEGLGEAEGFDETSKVLLKAAISGEAPANVLNLIKNQTGLTFRSGFEGTGENKNKTVTVAFDAKGNRKFEFVEAPKTREVKSLQVQENPLTGEKTFVGAIFTEDANGNPVIKRVTEEAAPKTEAEQEEADTDLIATLTEIGSVGELTPEAFLDSLTNREELSDEEIERDYKKALKLQGFEKVQKAVKKKKSARGFFKRLLKTDDIEGPELPFKALPDEGDET